VSGIALNQDYSYTWPWLLQAGITPYDPKTKQMLTPIEKAVEAMAFQADLVHKHKVSPVPVVSTDYSGPQKLLSARRAAMIVTGPWDLEPLRKTGGIDFGVAPLPRHADRGTPLTGTTLFVPAKAARPDLSWDFIKRITTRETERAATKEVGMLMPRVSWAKLPEIQADPVTKVFTDGFRYAVDPWQEVVKTGKSGRAEELLRTMYQNVVIRNRPAAEAVSAFVNEVRSLVGG
jgi:multiple sugar transport system substrate-binding protein